MLEERQRRIKEKELAISLENSIIDPLTSLYNKKDFFWATRKRLLPKGILEREIERMLHNKK